MLKKKILVIGDSSFTKVIINIIEDEAAFEIFGVIDCLNVGKVYLGYEVVGRKDDIPKILSENDIYGGVLAVGNNWMRKKVYDDVLEITDNFNFVTIMHPTAIVGKNVLIGKGSVLMAGVVVNSDSKIGEFCFLNTQSSLGHEGRLNDFSTLCFGVITGGNLNLGKYSRVSLGSNIIENIKIGSHTLVAPGSLVITDLPSYSIAVGIPAKVKRTRMGGEEYMSNGYKMNERTKF